MDEQGEYHWDKIGADISDQEWLDNVNIERRKDQSGAISYEAFEIIMDKLEKEWFDLVSLALRLSKGVLITLRSSVFLNLLRICQLKTQCVPSAMTGKERTRMQSSSAMAVTWLSIKVSDHHCHSQG
jgi:hypothetical protein